MSSRGKSRHTYKVYPKILEHLQGCRMRGHCGAVAIGATVVPWCMARTVVGRMMMTLIRA